MMALTPLAKALQSLEKVLFLLDHPSAQSAPFQTELRDSALQRFEYSYELCAKFIKRQLEQIIPNPEEIDQLSFQDLLRKAGEAALIKDVRAFMGYRQARNLTSHAYDEDKAKEIYGLLPKFLKDAQDLLTELRKRNPEA